MNRDWRASKLTNSYKKAISATREIQPEAEGFVVPSEGTKSNIEAFETLIKQNNTIIQLLIEIDQKLENLDSRVEQIERTAVRGKASPNITESIDELSKRLERVSLKEGVDKNAKDFKRSFRVYKNPQKILEDKWIQRK